MVACLTETKPEQNEEYIELFREQLKKRTLSSEWMLFAISDFAIGWSKAVIMSVTGRSVI